MEIFTYSKLQIGLLSICILIGYLFIRDGNRLNRKLKLNNCNRYFDCLFLLGEVGLFLDGLTSYSVNHLESIPSAVNMIFHLAFLLVYQCFIFTHFYYWLSVTDSFPRKRWHRFFCYMPIVLSSLVTILSISQIYYEKGEYTNYAQGIPVYVCFATMGLYSILTLVVFLAKKSYVQRNIRTGFLIDLVAVCVLMLIQMIYNEALVSSIAVALVIISIYLCLENPSLKYLEFYHDEMVMGFATLVEGKDGNTGGHIRRTSGYAVLIAKALRKNPKYRKKITKDYIDNLNKAAPMHDVGKISIPDSILQKPGKLTEEEFEVMKQHPVIGGDIIKNTFGHLDDDEYENMAYKIAVSHHEKWNGKGYPNHLEGTNIPLCARIMAVADVFDAVSAKRCYRDAMPLETCYQIIEEGRGKDFDPDIVDAFFLNRKGVETIYYSSSHRDMQ